MNLRVWLFSFVSVIQLLVPVYAQGIAYTWVDGEGVTHFSDSRPAGNGTTMPAVVQMNIPQNFTEADPTAEYYSITNQWKRVQQERSEKAELALKREQLRLDWYRARQEAREVELAALAREVEAEQPVVIVRDVPYYNWNRAGHRAPGQDHQHVYPDYPPWNNYHPYTVPQDSRPDLIPIKFSLGAVTGKKRDQVLLENDHSGSPVDNH